MTNSANKVHQIYPQLVQGMSMRPVRTKGSNTKAHDPVIEKRLREELQYPKNTIFAMLYQFYGDDFSKHAAFKDIAFVRPSITGKEIQFGKPAGGKMVDLGEKIIFEPGPGDVPLQARVDLMIALAIAKGWDAVEFDGSDEFILLAWETALGSGLEVSPKQGQLKLWEQFQALRAAKAQHVPEDLKAPADKADALKADELEPIREKRKIAV